MARSKSGGTRSYLRGRVGADVYSIGKDAKGKKQQIVRSLAESVANPQTIAQMRGRMIMSTVMQAVSAMSAIIDHSFDAVPAGQPNISEFIKENYGLIKADVLANPTSGNKFGLNKYGEKGCKQGAYVVAAGSAADIAGVVIAGADKKLTIALSADATIADLRSALGLSANDYFTAVAITDDSKFVYARFHVTQALASSTVISADNIGSIFTLDGNVNVTIAYASNTINITLADFSANCGIIVSRKVNASYVHNNVVLAEVENPVYASDDALPTYPTGSQRFLNGGGDSESSVTPEPEPVVEEIEITNLKTDGNDADVGGDWRNAMGVITGDQTGTVAFDASNVEAVGGAKVQTSTSWNSLVGGVDIHTITEGANTIASRTYGVDTSVWIVPATGDPFRLFYVLED